MIAVRCGHVESLDFIKEFYSNGDATKEEYTKALQLYQAYLGEIKSDKRDEAALFSDEYQFSLKENSIFLLPPFYLNYPSQKWYIFTSYVGKYLLGLNRQMQGTIESLLTTSLLR